MLIRLRCAVVLLLFAFPVRSLVPGCIDPTPGPTCEKCGAGWTRDALGMCQIYDLGASCPSVEPVPVPPGEGCGTMTFRYPPTGSTIANEVKCWRFECDTVEVQWTDFALPCDLSSTTTSLRCGDSADCDYVQMRSVNGRNIDVGTGCGGRDGINPDPPKSAGTGKVLILNASRIARTEGLLSFNWTCRSTCTPAPTPAPPTPVPSPTPAPTLAAEEKEADTWLWVAVALVLIVGLAGLYFLVHRSGKVTEGVEEGAKNASLLESDAGKAGQQTKKGDETPSSSPTRKLRQPPPPPLSSPTKNFDPVSVGHQVEFLTPRGWSVGEIHSQHRDSFFIKGKSGLAVEVTPDYVRALQPPALPISDATGFRRLADRNSMRYSPTSFEDDEEMSSRYWTDEAEPRARARSLRDSGRGRGSLSSSIRTLGS
eukprot:Sspe_Gene.47549::Locus_24301_Transcript_3_4_Confidence_0.333_Length_1379::g.47549::m.47549